MYCTTAYDDDKWFYIVLQYTPHTHMGLYYIISTTWGEYYPLYASVGNVQNHVRRAHRNAVAIIGFLAIPKSMLSSLMCACVLSNLTCALN